MGFEVVYKFYDRDESGNYKKDEAKELKKRVGDVYEEITLERLASVIMAQLARRDIWVFDVNIYEYKKTEISFRETKGGIVIKNKKFMLDNDSNVIAQEIREEQPQYIPAPHQAQPQPQMAQSREIAPVLNGQPANPLVTIQPNSRVLKYVTLDSDPQTLIKVKNSGLAFKADRRYAVYKETPHPKRMGVIIYTMLDDNNREVTVMDEYFVPADQILKNGFNSVADKASAPRMMYDNYENMDIPDIRGR